MSEQDTNTIPADKEEPIPFESEEYGFVEVNTSPESQKWEELERYIAGAGGTIVATQKKDIATQILNHAKNRTKGKKHKIDADISTGKMMDSRILAMMELSEALVISEGDLFQTIITPMSVGLTEIQIRHKDPKVKKQYAELFASLEMHIILEQMWLSIGIYGQAYPLEYWNETTKMLEGISLLNPKHVIIDPVSIAGKRPMYFAPPSEETVAALSIDKMFLNAVSQDDWNERKDTGAKGFPLKPETVTHIHEYKLAHQIYCIPPLVRAARSISTRAMLEEMIRSTIEGVKNQIILYKLENPRPGESAALQGKLSAHRAVRTGYLVWGANLSADQIMPDSVDALLGTESWIRITLDIMRKLGIHLRSISGEVGNVGQAKDFEVDVTFFVEKLKSNRASMTAWMNKLAKRYAKANGIEEPPIITLRPIDLAVVNQIKSILVPLTGLGLPSYHTALEMAGFEPDVEYSMRERENEEGWPETMRPFPSFAQNVVDPSGKTKTVESPQSKGRPEGTEDGDDNE